MKVKLDENLPARLAFMLRRLGHEVDTVSDEGLQGALDATVWAAARGDARFFIAQDLDFSDRRQFAPGTHPELLLIRLRQPGILTLLTRVESALKLTSLDALANCFCVLTDTRLRISRP